MFELPLRLKHYKKSSFWYLQTKGVPFSSLVLGYGTWPLLTNDLLNEAQSIYFFALVLMQWGYVPCYLHENIMIYPSFFCITFPLGTCSQLDVADWACSSTRRRGISISLLRPSSLFLLQSSSPTFHGCTFFLTPFRVIAGKWTYYSFSQTVFGTHGIPAQFFFIPLTFGLSIVM